MIIMIIIVVVVVVVVITIIIIILMHGILMFFTLMAVGKKNTVNFENKAGLYNRKWCKNSREMFFCMAVTLQEFVYSLRKLEYNNQ